MNKIRMWLVRKLLPSPVVWIKDCTFIGDGALRSDGSRIIVLENVVIKPLRDSVTLRGCSTISTGLSKVSTTTVLKPGKYQETLT